MAQMYYEAGADEIVFYDITASYEKRRLIIDVARAVAETIFIPFSVGGGISTVQDMRDVLLAGAEKVSVNSAAVQHPDIINEGAEKFGSQCVVLGMDVKRVEKSDAIPTGFEIVINGGGDLMGVLARPEICLNSIDADGVCQGYDIELTRLISESVTIPVIASGGAGEPVHLYEVLTAGRADAALIASMVHYGAYTISGIKEYLHERGVPQRMKW